MSKRICMLLTNAFDPDVRVYKEAKYLVEKGCYVEILCWDRDSSVGYPTKEELDGIHIIRFRHDSQIGTGRKQLGAYFKFIKDCKKYCKRNKFDYFHCNDFDGAVVWRFLNHGKAKMIFDMHEYYEDVGKKSDLLRRLMRRATIYMIKKSEYSLYENDLYLRSPYKRIQNKLLELKNYPNSDLVRCIPKTESSVFRIGYHGGVRSQIPEFTTLFESVKGLKDVRVDIHGGGPDLPKLKELEKKYDNVHIHGPFNGTSELTGLYSNTDVVYAGYRPYSDTRECAEVVKFFECIITGTPIILTEAYTGMGNRINKYGLGITCDTLDVDSVREAVLKFKEDREFWNKCHENEIGIADQYDWKNEVKILDIAYCL